MPSTMTRGLHSHQLDSGTPESAEGMWLPHPRHVFFAAESLVIDLEKSCVDPGTYNKPSRLHRNTSLR